MAITRRDFIAGLIGGPALVRLTKKAPRPIAGGFVDDGMTLGHSLRDGVDTSAPRDRRRVQVAIIGGGIAGLSAAWELERSGMRDFLVLELAPIAGGNARYGENEISAYPWAAHYVPVPGPRATLVRELFEELGVLHNGEWEERFLCFSPEERLFLYGEWHSGIEPEFAMSAKDRSEFRRFAELIDAHRSSGEFTIPSALGRPASSPLDRLSMEAWLQEQGFSSSRLRWYAEYACRDDYGASLRETSAWAGIHYFASREPNEDGPLTWPEGNGWIAKRLIAKLGAYIETNAPVIRGRREGARWRLTTPSTEYDVDLVIWAAPAFVVPYIVDELRNERRRTGFVYSPWLTANLTLDRWPAERGIEPAWDNVIYDSPGLGYVVATHQSLRTVQERTVWTYYRSFADLTPEKGRQELATRDWSYWRDDILNDLARAHPDIRDCVSRIDVLRLGHAMIRPTMGFLSVAERARPTPLPRFLHAHSDQSGLSLFEEAQYHGVMAARRALAGSW
ncbi:MAG TPA: FAD-dependent oxidoreductase [Gemmatimonadaceae bacterium]|nr:FAD-dependent oxidoreductase [Gemmatimonadaceae bacterium]